MRGSHSLPGPVFNASVHSDTPSVIRGDLIKLFCIITVEGAALDPGISLCLLPLPMSLSVNASRVIPTVRPGHRGHGLDGANPQTALLRTWYSVGVE